MQKAQITNNHRMLIEFWLKFTNILWPSQDWFLKTGISGWVFFFSKNIKNNYASDFKQKTSFFNFSLSFPKDTNIST